MMRLKLHPTLLAFGLCFGMMGFCEGRVAALRQKFTASKFNPSTWFTKKPTNTPNTATADHKAQLLRIGQPLGQPKIKMGSEAEKAHTRSLEEFQQKQEAMLAHETAMLKAQAREKAMTTLKAPLLKYANKRRAAIAARQTAHSAPAASIQTASTSGAASTERAGEGAILPRRPAMPLADIQAGFALRKTSATPVAHTSAMPALPPPPMRPSLPTPPFSSSGGLEKLLKQKFKGGAKGEEGNAAPNDDWLNAPQAPRNVMFVPLAAARPAVHPAASTPAQVPVAHAVATTAAEPTLGRVALPSAVANLFAQPRTPPPAAFHAPAPSFPTASTSRAVSTPIEASATPPLRPAMSSLFGDIHKGIALRPAAATPAPTATVPFAPRPGPSAPGLDATANTMIANMRAAETSATESAKFKKLGKQVAPKTNEGFGDRQVDERELQKVLEKMHPDQHAAFLNHLHSKYQFKRPSVASAPAIATAHTAVHSAPVASASVATRTVEIATPAHAVVRSVPAATQPAAAPMSMQEQIKERLAARAAGSSGTSPTRERRALSKKELEANQEAAKERARQSKAAREAAAKSPEALAAAARAAKEAEVARAAKERQTRKEAEEKAAEAARVASLTDEERAAEAARNRPLTVKEHAEKLRRERASFGGAAPQRRTPPAESEAAPAATTVPAAPVAPHVAPQRGADGHLIVAPPKGLGGAPSAPQRPGAPKPGAPKPGAPKLPAPKVSQTAVVEGDDNVQRTMEQLAAKRAAKAAAEAAAAG